MPLLADIYNCSGCLSCVDSCPTGALFSRWNEEGHLTYGVIADKCISCKKCERNCSAVNGYKYGINDLTLSTPFAVWSNDIKLREKSTSGGVFASIAKTVIESGGVVFGAAMLDSEVKHIGIDRIEDIYLLQGSKYAQSNTDGIYKQVLDVLKNDKIVLFSGLGCQVAGLLNYLPNSISTEKLYTIDLICGGVPTKYLISKYLEHEGVESIYAFRNKNKYELTVLDKRGNVQVVPLEQRPLPLCGFYTELTNKYICYDCRYIGAHRKSDMTIGDYWGDTEYTDEHQKGLSVAVVHNKKIHHLMSSSNLSIHLAGWETFLKHNPRMVYGKNDGVSTYRRKRLAEAIINDSYEKFVIDYANGATLKHPIYFLRKLVRYCQWKLMKDKRREYVLELLKKYSAK